MGFLWKLSERCLRVDVHGCTNVAGAGSARATFHSMITVLIRWQRLFFGGVVIVAAFSGYFFATAQKSGQKRPPLELRPCTKHRGSHQTNTVFMLWKRRSCASCAHDISASMHVNSQKTLRQFSQKAHDTCTNSMAWLMWVKNPTDRNIKQNEQY